MKNNSESLREEIVRLQDEITRLLTENERLARGMAASQNDPDLQQSEERLRTMFESHSAPMLLIDIKTGEIRHANAAAASFYGYSADQLRTMKIQQINQLSQLEVSEERRLAAEQKRNHFIFRHKLANGDIRVVEVHSSPITVNNEVLLFSIVHDITDRKKAEQALAESELRYRTIIDRNPLSIFVIRDGKYKYANAAAARQLGYDDPEDLEGVPFEQTIDPKDREIIRSRFRNSIGGRANPPMILTTIRTDGTRSVTESVSVPIKLEDGPAVLVMGQDMTERLRDEAQLRLLGMVLNQIADRVTITDLEGRITYVNDAECEALKRSREDLIGDTVRSYGQDESAGATQQEIIDTTRNEGSWRGEVVNFASDGSRVILDCRTQLVFDKNDQPIAMCGISTDITERKRIESALRDSEKRYRGYVDNAPDGIFVIDSEARCIDANPAAERLSGYSRDELIGVDIRTLFSDDTREETIQRLSSALANQQFNGEIPIRHKDGHLLWWDLSAVKLYDGRYLCFCKDITETRRLRQMETRAQRLETAGRIAGQVAHDFNNMLGPLMAYPELLREHLAHDSEALTFLESIENAAQRMGEVNQQLLTLGRRAHYSHTPLNLNTIVRNVLKDMEAVPNTLVIETDLDPNLMNVKGGGAQLHRAFANIIQNARDTLQDIGTISITTRNYYVDEVSIAYGRVPKGEYVKVIITDNGSGIPDHLLQSIFDPFVTTKSADKKRGSGLGLSVVDAVIKDHKGFLDLSTRIGEGTTFYVYLPVTREEADSETPSAPSRGDESILVIDDDPIQRQVTEHLLSRLGYSVVSAQSGEEAVELIKQHSFDLLVLDMVMPDGIDGAETYRLISEINPDQRAIIVSGYSETERIHEAQKMGAGRYLRKPFSQRDIAFAVRNELDQSK
jgi:PAS domain S-box-containing protein